MSFGRLERTPGPQPMSEINMTPLVDVMLVLVVIFIITAPLMASSIKLDLPKADAIKPNSAPAFVALAVDLAGQAYLQDAPVTLEELASRLGQTARHELAARLVELVETAAHRTDGRSGIVV